MRKLFNRLFGGKKAQMAASIKWEDRILIIGNSTTKSGFNICSSPYYALPIDASNEKIGELLKKALTENNYNVPDPDWKDRSLNHQRYKAANVKSEKAYMKNARSVSVYQYDGIIHLTPSRNGGTKGENKGFHDITSETIQINNNCDNEELGSIVKKLWDMCVFD